MKNAIADFGAQRGDWMYRLYWLPGSVLCRRFWIFRRSFVVRRSTFRRFGFVVVRSLSLLSHSFPGRCTRVFCAGRVLPRLWRDRGRGSLRVRVSVVGVTPAHGNNYVWKVTRCRNSETIACQISTHFLWLQGN